MANIKLMYLVKTKVSGGKFPRSESKKKTFRNSLPKIMCNYQKYYLNFFIVFAVKQIFNIDLSFESSTCNAYTFKL